MSESETKVVLEEKRRRLFNKLRTAIGSMAQYAREVELPRVEAALVRLASHEYGYCLECETQIEADRLQHIPEITTCKGCARRTHVERSKGKKCLDA